MRTYMLQGHDRVVIGRSALRLTISTQMPSDDVVLTARRGGGPDRSAIRPARGLMILPSVVDRTVVLVEPRAGLAMFPPGTVVSLTLQSDPPGPDADTVLVHAVDVSGSTQRELALVEVAGPGLAVSAVDAQADVDLPELAAAARSEARRWLGRDRVPDGAGVDLVVGIDTSASMAPALADGSVGAALEILAGLWHVVGRDRRFEICLTGDRPCWLPETPVETLAATTTAEIMQGGLGCGFRSAAPELERNHPRRAVTYVVTDGPPADAPALAAAQREQSVRHLFMLGARTTGNVPGLASTWLGPPLGGASAAAHLMQSRRELADVVSSLLVGCLSDDAGPERGIRR